MGFTEEAQPWRGKMGQADVGARGYPRAGCWCRTQGSIPPMGTELEEIEEEGPDGLRRGQGPW